MESFTESTRPFHADGFNGYDPRLASQHFGGDSSPIFADPAPYANGDDFFSAHPVHETLSPQSMGGYSSFSPVQNGGSFDGGFGSSNGPILPEMLPEAGFALIEWRRQNAIRLAEKEMEEKEMLQQIREEAEEYKAEFYRKRMVACETHRTANREKEKLYLENREKFHAEAEKNHWKAIAELIPHEVPTIEKRGKKKDEKKPSIVVVKGPKPGKPTDLSRMRQLLGKLKHNPPPHMTPKQPPLEPKKDAKVGSSSSSSPTASFAAGNAPSKGPSMAAATPMAVAVA